MALDWPSLTVPVEHGGMGMSATELAIALDELGRVADPTPLLATTSQYVPVLAECGGAGRAGDLLAAVCAGTTGTVAFAEDTVRARPAGDGWDARGYRLPAPGFTCRPS